MFKFIFASLKATSTLECFYNYIYDVFMFMLAKYLKFYVIFDEKGASILIFLHIAVV